MPRVGRLVVGIVILLSASSKVGLCQLLACQTIQGDWYNYGNGQEFNLTQNGQNVTGSMTWLSCEGNQVWPISGPDWIGYSPPQVEYYRAKNRVPCGTSFTQVLVIDAAYDPNNTPSYGSYVDDNGDIFFGVPYETNTLGGSITATEVQSIRNGQESTNTDW